jgi:hypothetical protein
VIFKQLQQVIFLTKLFYLTLLVISPIRIKHIRNLEIARGPYVKLPNSASNYQMQAQMQKHSLKNIRTINCSYLMPCVRANIERVNKVVSNSVVQLKFLHV